MVGGRSIEEEGSASYKPLRFHRWDVTVLMKEAKTTAAVEELSCIPTDVAFL